MDFASRIQRVQHLLKEERLDGLIVDQVVDLYYLMGQTLSLGRLLIERERVTLFVDGRYYEAMRASLPFAVHLVKDYGKGSAFEGSLLSSGKRIAFDAEGTSYKSYQALVEVGDGRVEWVPLVGPIKRLRAIKDREELALLKEAAELGSLGYEFAVGQLKEGVTEREVADELEIFWKRSGGERLGFASIIGFGEHSAIPHHRPTERRLKRGDLVLIDIGVVKKSYHSDMTRCLFFGPPDRELETIYEIVLEAQQRALEAVKPGVLTGAVDRAARGWIEERGFGKEFCHGLGHGVGLEIHELPILRSEGPFAKEPLYEGMVITIEPGIYLPQRGGVRIEDTVVVTQEGYLNLSRPSKKKVVLS